MTNIIQVGLGYWGPNILRNLLAQPDVTVKVFDVDQDAEAKAEPFLSDIKFSEFLNEAPTEADLSWADAVVIVTPPKTHYDLVEDALNAGCHVFVEKPLTMDNMEAECLVELAEEKKLTLMVGHTFLFVPEVRKIKELIQADTVGTVLYIESNRKNLGKYQDSGVIWDLAPHDIALLNYWLPNWYGDEEILSDVITLGNEAVSDIASIHLRTTSPVVRFYYQLNLSWLHPIKERITYIVGDRGMLVYDMMAKDKVVLVDRHVKAHQEGYQHIDGPSTTVPILDKEEPLFKEMKEFLACVRDGGDNVSDGRLGLEVVEVIANLMK